LQCLNLLEAEGWFSRNKEQGGRKIWPGVALRIDGKINSSLSAMKNTAFLIRLLCVAVISRPSGGWNNVWQTKQSIKSCFNSLVGCYVGIMRIQAENDDQFDEDAAKTAATRRLEEILSEAGSIKL